MSDVVDSPAEGRLEVAVDGQVAELLYMVEGERMTIVHTGVPGPLGGRGLGGRLVRAAVDRAARDGLTVVPLCPFARRWMRGHPGEIGAVQVDWADGTS
ncbi:MAG TPA: N-acetyltransferase [Acidimicrobiales bacterium]|nr:N-acetyltransferase [Acidimicrobiales bacterium]